MVGVFAERWDVIVVPFGNQDEINLSAGGAGVISVTDNGNSNKESDWFRIAE